MSEDEPITLANLTTALAQFHREVFLPDFERVIGDLCDRTAKRMDWNFDAIIRKLDGLQTTAEESNACVARMNACLDRMEQPSHGHHPSSD